MRCRSSINAVAVAAALVTCSALVGCVGHLDDASGLGGTSGVAGSAGRGGSAGAPCVPSGSGGVSGAIPPTFDTVKLVLGGGGAITQCAAAPCHAVGGMAPPGNPLTLQNTPDLYANMTSYVAKDCGNLKLVNPGKPEESALLKILKGPCGAVPRMPYMCSGEACIPDDYIAALSQWIANCAPER
jgi:hypothetical protein